MAFQVLDRNDPRFPKGGPDPEEDRLARQQLAHARKVDEKEEFTSETIMISAGPKNTNVEIIVKYPRSARIVETRDDLDNVIHRERVWTTGRFAFAVYAENPQWHKAARDEWEAGARNSLEKFAAVHGGTIINGPRAEDTNRYNLMIELRSQSMSVKAIEQAILDATAEAEKVRLAGDHLVMITGGPGGLFGLSEKGRLFFRELDSRGNMNMPGVGQKYLWREVEGPFT